MPYGDDSDAGSGIPIQTARCRLVLGVVVCVGWLASFAAPHEIEHPGILHREDKCSSCHIDKTQGKSVHSAMAIPCTVCHISQTQGDMTTMHLSLPRETLCLDCHDESMVLQRHRHAVKGLCVDCHDAHSSNRPMLLRRAHDTSATGPLRAHSLTRQPSAVSKRLTKAP